MPHNSRFKDLKDLFRREVGWKQLVGLLEEQAQSASQALEAVAGSPLALEHRGRKQAYEWVVNLPAHIRQVEQAEEAEAKLQELNDEEQQTREAVAKDGY